MLVQRVTREHRRAIVPLAIALVVNVIVYGVVVYPLSQRVANIEQRDRTAEAQLLAAQREHAQAVGTLTGKDRAAAELATFYKDVLPSDLAGARRLTHLRLAQLARESNLKFLRATLRPGARAQSNADAAEDRDGRCRQLPRHARVHPRSSRRRRSSSSSTTSSSDEGADGGPLERDAAAVHVLPRRGCPARRVAMRLKGSRQLLLLVAVSLVLVVVVLARRSDSPAGRAARAVQFQTGPGGGREHDGAGRRCEARTAQDCTGRARAVRRAIRFSSSRRRRPPAPRRVASRGAPIVVAPPPVPQGRRRRRRSRLKYIGVLDTAQGTGRGV